LSSKELVVKDVTIICSIFNAFSRSGHYEPQDLPNHRLNRIQKYKNTSLFSTKIPYAVAFRHVHGFWAIHWKRKGFEIKYDWMVFL
jgi:hypothetical protein